MANKESYFASLHILMRAILMAQRTLAAGFADTGIEKAAAKSAPAGKYQIPVNPVILSNFSLFLCVFCAFLRLKNPFNQRNPRLINDLRSTKDYVRNYELFMQNKANFRKSQMNVTTILTKEYENRTLGERGKKQSQTNPNKPKFKKAKMNVTFYITKAYENKPPNRATKKQSQTSKRQKPIQTSLPKRIMKITAILGPDKTNPNKAKQTQPVVSLPALLALSEAEGSEAEGSEAEGSEAEGSVVERSNLFQRQKNVFGRAKILTITNMDANFKKYVAYRLFIERTLFGR